MGSKRTDNYKTEEVTRIERHGEEIRVYFFAKGTGKDVPFQCSDPELVKILEKEAKILIGKTVNVEFTSSGKLKNLELT